MTACRKVMRSAVGIQGEGPADKNQRISPSRISPAGRSCACRRWYRPYGRTCTPGTSRTTGSHDSCRRGQSCRCGWSGSRAARRREAPAEPWRSWRPKPAGCTPIMRTRKCARFSSRSPWTKLPEATLKKIARSCNASQRSRCSISVWLCLSGHASDTSLRGAACTTVPAGRQRDYSAATFFGCTCAV